MKKARLAIICGRYHPPELDPAEVELLKSKPSWIPYTSSASGPPPRWPFKFGHPPLFAHLNWAVRAVAAERDRRRHTGEDPGPIPFIIQAILDVSKRLHGRAPDVPEFDGAREQAAAMTEFGYHSGPFWPVTRCLDFEAPGMEALMDAIFEMFAQRKEAIAAYKAELGGASNIQRIGDPALARRRYS